MWRLPRHVPPIGRSSHCSPSFDKIALDRSEYHPIAKIRIFMEKVQGLNFLDIQYARQAIVTILV